MNIVVCGHPTAPLGTYSVTINHILQKRSVAHTLACFHSGKEMLEYMAHQTDVSVALLDASYRFCIAAAQKIKQIFPECLLVFLTGQATLALEHYKIRAFRYLPKPVSDQMLDDLMQDVLTHLSGKNVVLTVGTRRLIIPQDEITHIESAGRKLYVHTLLTQHSLYMKLNDFEKLLCSDFVRCHQSFIVNVRHCRQLCTTQVILNDGKHINISRPHIKQTRAAFLTYHKQLTGGYYPA